MIYMSYAEWDPSGKLLLTASSNTKTFMIWNSFGSMIFKDTVFNLCSLLKKFPLFNGALVLEFKSLNVQSKK